MFQYIRMPFGLANSGSVYSRMLDVAMKDVAMKDVAMKDVDRDFWTCDRGNQDTTDQD